MYFVQPTAFSSRFGQIPNRLTLASVVRRGLRLLGAIRQQDEPTRRLLCLLRMITEPNVDDRYIPFGFLVQSVIQRLSPQQFNVLIRRLKSDLTDPTQFGPTLNDSEFIAALKRLDGVIFMTMGYLRRHVATHGGMSNPGKVQIKDWIAGRQRDRNSIYSCYGGVRY